ncbi:MAG: hypothetical protein JWP81_2855 [Ferruginibacter sp.]|nr:hypothetical protein [Ferruginibacter sp.]
MSYQSSNGHTEALMEPNSVTSVAMPVVKKTKKNLPVSGGETRR